MALAKYFSKDLLAINRLIKTNQNAYEEILNNKIVAIAFDENAIITEEGKNGLDLIIRLIARFYPKIKLIDLSEQNSETIERLQKLALGINGNIEIVSDTNKEDVLILAGLTNKPINPSVQTFYFGSDNWISKYSIKEQQSFNTTANPFGCGVAACIVISNVFRNFFYEFMEYKELDTEFQLSVYSFNTNDNPVLDKIVFKDVVIAGIGAIGNGLVWSLSKISNLQGKLALVDGEEISKSNLQRYVLFTESNENKDKVKIAKNFFNQTNLKVSAFKGEWEDYVKKRKNWNIDCVAVGIDNEKGRVGIQSSLPRILFNAFTEPESIGISKHLDFVNQPCLACYYIPNSKKKNRTEEVAENCGISDKVDLIKDYYNFNANVDDVLVNKKVSLLQEISINQNIPIEELSQYKGKKVDEFYSDYICGGTVLQLSKKNNEIHDVDAPLAFQSAIAGLLLASEVVKYHMQLDNNQFNRIDFYHLSPITELNPFQRDIAKNVTGNCLCNDEYYIDRYNEKWKK